MLADDAAALIVTADDAFAESARRWCAAAGRDALTDHDRERIRRGWRSAPVVLVDGALVASLAAAELPRRDDVLVVAADPDALWRQALDMGAQYAFALDQDEAIVGAIVRALDGGGEACAVTVVGACGGVGASTLAVAVSQLAARRGLRCVLVDADRDGGGLGLLAGGENAHGSHWSDLDGAIGHIGASELAASLPTHRDVAMVTFDQKRAPVRAPAPVLAAAARGFDLVTADVPRHLDDLGRELVSRSVLTVLVVPRRIDGVAAARVTAQRLAELTDAVAIVTRASPAGIAAATISAELQLPVLADVRASRRLPLDLEHGLGPLRARTVSSAASRILDAVGLR